MTKDLRSRNEYFSTESVAVYFREYQQAVFDALSTVDTAQLAKAHQILTQVRSGGGRVFVAGNGGSAAISDHLNCDFTKGVQSNKKKAHKVHSLVGSMALFSALANDVAYANTFSEQLIISEVNHHDCVVLISSSGNSTNILQAARTAFRFNAPIIGLTGFTGGELFIRADAKLHVSFSNYGVVEDSHQILMHILAQYDYISA